MSSYAHYAHMTQEQPPVGLRIYRAALYIRLSKEDGDRLESESVMNQRRILNDFVSSQPDLSPVDEYIDDGFSGVSFDRPAFRRMISDITERRVDCVIVKDSSRFGRNLSESGRYFDEFFPRYKVRFIAVNDAIDSAKSMGPGVDFMNYSMRGMVNEFYVANTSGSIRATLDMERRRGDFIGSFAKYGYKKSPADHHKLVIDEDAAEVVRLIFRLYLQGEGVRSIVRALNDRGIMNPSSYKRSLGLNYKARAIGGSPLWCDKSVRRILSDEMYTGTMVQGVNRKLSYKSKSMLAVPKDEWIRVGGTHEAIIGREDFETVQRMLGRGAKGCVSSGRVDLFAGLLRCADCGHALIKKTNRNPDKTYVYYRCSTHCKCSGACSPHTVNHNRLYSTVLSCIQKMVAVAANADEVLKALRQDQSDKYRDGLRTQLQSCEKELERITRLMADLYPDYKSGLLNADQYKLNKEKYEQLQKNLRGGIERLKASLGEQDDSQSYSNEFIDHFIQHGNIDRLTRPLLTELIEQITVGENGDLEITFRFRDAFEEARSITDEKTAQAYHVS